MILYSLFLDPSFYPYAHRNLMESFLGQDPSYIQVSWKSTQFCVILLPNKPTDGRRQKHNYLGDGIYSFALL